MRRRFDFALCGLCGTPTDATASNCPVCGGSPLFLVENGYVLEFPAQTIPCPRCGSAAQPVRFHGWAELLAVIWWVREGRLSAYLCPDCARRQTIKSLLFTTVLGWWSIPSWFFYGWRGTYINWRAVFAAPARPHEWGALSGEDFAEILADMRSDEELDADEEWIVNEPALRDLSPAQLELVLSAEGLYELLGSSTRATADELRRAYRQRCKELHPDLHQGARDATEDMVRLNRAWEILRTDPLREAYDWLQAHRSEAAA